jgi:hypothetical protein
LKLSILEKSKEEKGEFSLICQTRPIIFPLDSFNLSIDIGILSL